MNILFPNGKDKAIKLSDDTIRSMAIDEIVEMIAVTDEDRKHIKNEMTFLPNDVETIKFRQEMLKDFLENEEFSDEMEIILRKLNVLNEFSINNHFAITKKANLWELIDYMQEMEVYIEIVEELNALFSKYEVSSKGLKEIAGLLKDVIAEDKINDLKEIVGELRTEVAGIRSITAGINLTPELRPEEVIIKSFNTIPFESKINRFSVTASLATRKFTYYTMPSQTMKYVCDEMEKELGKSVKKYKVELRKYIDLKGYFLLDICKDLKFYLLIAKFGRKLQKEGFPISFPIINNDSDTVIINGVYNIRLMKKDVEKIVKNDFEFSNKEKVFILTGPNRGGKTMLTQAVGISAILAALGLYVTAEKYEGFYFTNILTHFPVEENQTLDLGRLGEEAVRIQEIVKEANDKTLMLLNETYSSTSAVDGLYLAKDLVHVLKYKGVPTIYNTHLHDLARNTEEMNKWEGEAEVVSITMEIVNNENTYKVLRKEPDSSSFAKNIALKYGVTFEQMVELTK